MLNTYKWIYICSLLCSCIEHKIAAENTTRNSTVITDHGAEENSQGETIAPLEESIVRAEQIETTTDFRMRSSEIPLSTTMNTNDDSNERSLSIISNMNVTNLDEFLLNLDRDYGNTCLLDDIKNAMLWWTFPNGTLRTIHMKFAPIISRLDLSYRHICTDEALYDSTITFKENEIVVFSAAHNNLTSVPQRTLESFADSLRYLTLSGNQFNAQQNDDVISKFINETRCNSTKNTNNSEHHSHSHGENTQNKQKGHARNDEKILSKSEKGIAWATFPFLPNLLELDISNCQIEYIGKAVFHNLTNLKGLYMSHNKMLTIPADAFVYVYSLQFLDLSFTNVFGYNYQVSTPTLEAIINLIYGVKIQQTTFKHLPNLVYLDLSHTKLTRNSAVAFTNLGGKLRYLSLCYTAFPMLGNIFKNTALVGLDLSGNAYAAYNILDDAFEGISDSLSVLYFERSNLKDISWVKDLKNLKLLGLAGNNINSLTFDIFSALSSLQVLDLSSNHVGNWYSRVFTKNEDLRVLNLRDNNINIITSEMLKDFSSLNYLSLGDNNFVCDCMLRDIVDAASNNQNSDCSRNSLAKDWLTSDDKLTDTFFSLDLSNINGRLNRNISTVIASKFLKRMKKRVYTDRFNAVNDQKKSIKKMRFVFKTYNSFKSTNSCPSPETQSNSAILNMLNGSLNFQLMDYEDEHYWCFNETEKLSFFQLNCNQRSLVDDIARQLNGLTFYVLICVGTLLGVSLIVVIVYIKRWHIYYYYSSLKSAALMSAAAKDNADKFNGLNESSSNMIYDIFISYCQDDRDWILNELMPNVEETGDVSICLHERDFQIGVTILDNIISCMDRSRSLMLIISSNFLLSHWCQFEMHLAQRRDHLILVFLEDIPRSKRPKNLQYLMDVKTYIKWPGRKNKSHIRPEDYKLFWKRLKRSLQNIGN